MKTRCNATAVMLIGLLASSLIGAAEPATSRYQVRGGSFWDTASGRKFTPRGFNYIRLHRGHGTFDPDFYDPKASDALFARLSQDGFNTVRVFVNGFAHQTGAIASRQQPGLSPKYVANVADFLRRADACGVAVVLSMDSYPRVSPFWESPGQRAPEIDSGNAHVLERTEVEARARYFKAFIEALRSIDADCLRAILAYDLQNEWCYVVAPPFTLEHATVKAANGRSYELPAQRQELADDAAVFCIDTLADAIRAAHPRAPIWAGVFTYRAVGKNGPGDFHIEQAGWKNRVPFRPLAILRSRADVLDLHLYSESEDAFAADLRSVEFDAVRRAARERGAAIVAGEFGAFKSRFPSASAAAEWTSRFASLFDREGFVGWCYWTYDTHEQDEQLWHACASEKVIYWALKAQVRPTDARNR